MSTSGTLWPSHRRDESHDGVGQYPLGRRIERGDAATAPLPVTLITHALPVADVAKQIDAEYGQLLRGVTQADLYQNSHPSRLPKR